MFCIPLNLTPGLILIFLPVHSKRDLAIQPLKYFNRLFTIFNLDGIGKEFII